MRQQGIVKWFNSAKAFGFITANGGGPDVFAHITRFPYGTKPADVKPEMKVEFETTPATGDRGASATNISFLKKDE
ncbi:Cold shock protein ScoF [Cladobotryum mycophilum]|uniref:Cold shock protein ScoF n=1 Tax=Cladobotryum mycophilum TaxID=491253 RepID=A0ABR0SU53_9HYPO